jgi:AcrR family transcriptional regulator
MRSTTGRSANAPVRLSREMIIQAGVRIAARGQHDGLTGASLGEELGVDRSAVWRHFPDKDALLLAVGDRLLAMAVAQVPPGLGPRSRLEYLALAVVDVFETHPCVGAAMASRTTRGEGEFAAVEMMLGALGELGLPAGEIPRFYRMLADTLLAYAGMCAQYAVLPQAAKNGDEHAWTAEYPALDPHRYPAIAAHATALAKVDDDTVFDTLLEAFWIAIDTHIHRARSDAATQ